MSYQTNVLTSATSGLQEAVDHSLSLLKAPPHLSVSEWADMERYLSPESSAEPGKWQTIRAEYQRGMMDAASNPAVERVTILCSSQVGKTEVINNIVGYYITHDPSPMLIIQPTLEMGMAWSKDRFAPMLRDTPCLEGKVKDARSKISSNTILHKTFPGGHLTVAGANSPSSLASRPIRMVLQDEIDRFPASAGTEGDPCSLADKRAMTFWNRKLVKTSTPTVEGVSRIQMEWEQSNQSRFYVPCPKCGQYQLFEWAGIKFEKSDPEHTTHFECAGCQAKLSDLDKVRMVAKGRWQPTYPDRQGHFGFHINELYSPWSSWKKVVIDFLEKKQHQETLRVWINTSLGECWREEESYSIDTDKLAARTEQYVELPMGVVLLTAGVDVQDDRLEYVVKGWGQKEESWFIQKGTLYGSPGRTDTWKLLDDRLQSEFVHESGLKLSIVATCVDSGGHFTTDVYKYTRAREHRRYFSTKGFGGFGRPFIGKATRNNKIRAIVVPLGVDSGKEKVYDRLRIDDPGPGYLHFNEQCDEEYFLQLTAEKQVVKYSKGFPTRVWVLKDSRRNEMLDCEVLNLAAFYLLNVDTAKMAQRMEAKVSQLKHPAEDGVVEKPRQQMSGIRRIGSI